MKSRSKHDADLTLFIVKIKELFQHNAKIFFACYQFNLIGERWMIDTKSLAAKKLFQKELLKCVLFTSEKWYHFHIYSWVERCLWKYSIGYLIQHRICNRWLIAIQLFIVKALLYNYVNVVVLTVHKHLKLICWFRLSLS